MARQGLANRPSTASIADVAAAICGLHAQLMSSAELTLWARIDELKQPAVGEALWEKRELFKSWGMRGTLHLLPSGEYRMWQGAWSTYDHYLKGAWFKYFGVTADELQRLVDAVGEVLDGTMLTREELAAAVVERTGSEHMGEKLKESWGAMLKPASFQGKLCFAPNRDRNVRFTHPSSWLGVGDAVPSEEALDFVTRHFLHANGPATREDYGRWWGMSPAKAGKLIQRLGDEVAGVDLDGRPYWMLATDLTGVEVAELDGVVNLVPAFDQYVIAATLHVEKLLSGPFKGRIYRPQGWISPVVLVNGRMEGVWQHEKKAGALAVSVEPFGKLSKAVKRAVEAEAERLARFFGVPEVRVEYAD